MHRSGGKGRNAVACAFAIALTATAACTTPKPPPPTTTTTTTTTTGAHDHDMGGDAPYLSPDDPRLTPERRQRAKDLIARTEVGMKRFPDVASLTRAGYTSIRDSLSGYEHFVNWPLVNDGHELDADHIEAVVAETKPGQAKRVVAAMYMLSDGTTMATAPDVAGPLTPWHNHKDLCWDATGHTMLGVYRLGRCIPLGTVKEMNPMLHVWVTPNVCGPFAEIDDTNGPIDKWLQSTGQEPPPPANPGCAHVHGGDHS